MAMITAITAEGNTMSSRIAGTFARCAWFVLVDPAGGHVAFHENPFRQLPEQAGVSAVAFLAEKGVKKIISGEFGDRIRNLTEEHHIQLVVITDTNKTIGEIIDLLTSTFKKEASQTDDHP
ncbi:MAG TPA: NifB/NifX family molybdenum-iron cluster-binding protein [Bacteroidales bacterium]|nr:NifB/NifX family molybdenum-iron cluster-binding protein [Bacteroidales bacterium]HSA44025.1 NifB/NifX family molybdenum-iron cluster-binding protein [Bacteroidales bacterium]